MTTTDEDWVPTEEEVRHYTRTWFTESDMDRFLARVRRVAAREALDGLADESIHVNWEMDGPSFALRVRRFKNRNYPEETT